MKRILRKPLRIAMVLLLLAGVALVVYSNLTHEGANGPFDGNDAAAGNETVPPPSAGNGEEEVVKITDPVHEIRRATGAVEGRITGKEALVHVKDKLYMFVEPVVIIYDTPATPPEPGAPPPSAPPDGRPAEKLRITAAKATFNEIDGTALMDGDVRAVSSTYEVRADSALYDVNKRTVVTESAVRLLGYRSATRHSADESGTAQTPPLATETVGRGMAADINLERVRLRSGVSTKLFNLSGEWLAGDSQDPDRTEKPLDATITCKGEMLYDHLARKLTYNDTVGVVFGPKTLDCSEQLTISMGRAEARGTLSIREMTAAGAVVLAFDDMTARGDALEWRSVTQTALITGKPATVVTPRFTLKGGLLTLFRLTNGLRAEGPGNLLWKPTAKDNPAPAAEAAAPPHAPRGAPASDTRFRFRPDSPVEIQWTKSMTRNADEHFARFEGDVVARTGEHELRSDELQIDFAEQTGELTGINGSGNARLITVQDDARREVTCGTFAWDAAKGTVDLRAPEGEDLTIDDGRLQIVSSRVVVDDARQTFQAPAPGRLTVAPDPAADDDKPAPGITVTWKEKAVLERGRTPVAVFTGDVTARQPNRTMRGKSVRVEFDKDQQPTRIVASGDAVIDVISEADNPAEAEAAPALLTARPGHIRLAGDEIVIEPPKDLISSDKPGKLSVLDGENVTDSITWTDSVRLDAKTSTAEFKGRVLADTRDGTMHADEATLEFKDDAAGAGRVLKHISATGHVRFASKAENPWQIASPAAEINFVGNGRLHEFIAREKVSVTDQGRELTTSTLLLTFAAAPDAPPEHKDRLVLSHAEAIKNVHVKYRNKEIEAGGDRLEWDRKDDVYILRGEPAWRKVGALQERANTLYIHRATGEKKQPD